MIAVIFEVVPNEGKREEYLDIAANLKPELSHMEGFISIERFQSFTDPEKVLSLFFGKMKKVFSNGEISKCTATHKKKDEMKFSKIII